MLHHIFHKFVTRRLVLLYLFVDTFERYVYKLNTYWCNIYNLKNIYIYVKYVIYYLRVKGFKGLVSVWVIRTRCESGYVMGICGCWGSGVKQGRRWVSVLGTGVNGVWGWVSVSVWGQGWKGLRDWSLWVFRAMGERGWDGVGGQDWRGWGCYLQVVYTLTK